MTIRHSSKSTINCAQRVLEEQAQLNYMLIRKDLKEALRLGMLVKAKPVASWAGEPRAFLMCRSLYDEIENGKKDPDEKVRKRWAVLEGSIGHFIEGGFVHDGLLKQLLPRKYEHWELICRKPKPSLRVFGRFYQPDVFVGTHVLLRKGLGGMWSSQFEHQKLVCEQYCNDCGLSDPYSDPPKFRYESYITDNASQKIRVLK